MMERLSTATRLILGPCAIALFVAPLPAQSVGNSVKSRLDSLAQKYDIDADGDFKITFAFPGNRTQLVLVSGKVYDVAGVPMRNVFSAVAKVDEDGIAGRAVDLLKANNGYRIGAYEIEGKLLLLSLKIPDAVTGAQLVAAMKLAASVADDKEKELSGARDTF